VRPGAGASLGYATSLPANIRIGWKGLPGTNAVQKSVNYGRKKFYSTGPRFFVAVEMQKRLSFFSNGSNQRIVRHYFS
jgi:hypothetical protein